MILHTKYTKQRLNDSTAYGYKRAQAAGLRRERELGRLHTADARLGLGRIVTSRIEAPNLSANLV